MGVIYQAYCKCHPEEGPRYVGQTGQPLHRRADGHLYNSRTPGRPGYGSYMNNWIRKHGEGNIVFEVLEDVPLDELNDREDFWIRKLRNEGANLTNASPGGGQPRGWKMPADVVEANRQRMMGRPVSEETREKIRQSKIGKKRPPEVGERIAEKLRGRKHDPEVVKRRNLSISEAWTEERRLRHSEQVRGELSAHAKLTDEKVREMRRIREDEGVPYHQIAKLFGISKKTAMNAVKGVTWKHVID